MDVHVYKINSTYHTMMILKIDRHDITEIALKVALNTIILTNDDSCHIHLHLHLICFC